MESKNYTFELNYFRSSKIVKCSAYLLLFLCTASFSLENQILFEGDLMELVESTEKDSDQKEKKLLFQTDIYINANLGSRRIKSSLLFREIMPKSIFLERQTPPPELT